MARSAQRYLLILTGSLHTLFGLVSGYPWLGEMVRNGVVGAAGTSSEQQYLVWFLVAGVGLILMGVLGFTEAGVFGPKPGLNSAGLGLVSSGLTSAKDDGSRLGLPLYTRCSEVLQQRTPDAAALSKPWGCSANLLPAQPPERVQNLEVAPHAVWTLRSEDGALVYANHFSDPPVQGRGFERAGSVARQGRLSGHFSGETLLLNDAQNALRDTENVQGTICRHPDLGGPDYERCATVVSVVMDLCERVLYISDGPPDTAPYGRVALAQAMSGSPA